jgi:hypothetical protein
MDWTSEKVYYLVKNLMVKVLMLKPKALYLMLADKINQLIQRMPESSVRAELEINHIITWQECLINNR